MYHRKAFGPQRRVPAMPLWGLAGVVFGGLWLCLWRRRCEKRGEVA